MPTENDFTALERAVLDWLKENHADEAVRAQAAGAEYAGREWSGTGFTVRLEVPRELEPAVGVPWPVNGPALESDDIDIAGDTMFWGEGGYLSYFEMYSFGEFFNEEVRDFRLVAFEE